MKAPFTLKGKNLFSSCWIDARYAQLVLKSGKKKKERHYKSDWQGLWPLQMLNCYFLNNNLVDKKTTNKTLCKRYKLIMHETFTK